MGREPSRELLLHGGDLLVATAKHGHQGTHHLTIGGHDRCRGGQLRRRQRVVDGNHPCLEVAAPASADQRAPHRCPGQLAAQLRGWRQLQHRKGLGLGELGAERGQRARMELAQGAAQRVDVPLPRPDQVLVGAGQDLDRLGERAVAGDLAVVVAIGADQIGQHLGVASVGLGPRHLWRPR